MGSARTRTIKPATKLRPIDWAELWYFRDLFRLLIRREILVKYKQTVLGAAWIAAQPLVSMILFSVFLGKLAKMPNDGIPYPIFYFAALVPWGYFSGSFSASGNSLTYNAYMLSKVYFPRIMLPIVPAIARLVDFFIGMVLLFLMMLFYGIYPGIDILLMPVLLLIMFLFVSGCGIWFSALGIKYRDVSYTLSFASQALMFASPVMYPLSMIPEKYQTLYSLNPMVGVISGFRNILAGGDASLLMPLSIGAGVSAILFITGLLYFNSVERMFADVA